MQWHKSRKHLEQVSYYILLILGGGISSLDQQVLFWIRHEIIQGQFLLAFVGILEETHSLKHVDEIDIFSRIDDVFIFNSEIQCILFLREVDWHFSLHQWFGDSNLWWEKAIPFLVSVEALGAENIPRWWAVFQVSEVALSSFHWLIGSISLIL
mgnify:CR=1 FL=1